MSSYPSLLFMTKNMNSGSYFLHSLLDGNPDILVMPVVFERSLVYQYESRSYWSIEFLLEFLNLYYKPMITESIAKKDKDLSNQAKSIIHDISQLFTLEKRKHLFDFMKKKILGERQHGNGFEQFFKVFSLAYRHVVLNTQKEYKYFLVPLHTVLVDIPAWSQWCGFAGPAEDAIPGSRFLDHIKLSDSMLIHITREPRANYASGMYASNHGGRSPVESFLELYREYYRCIVPFRQQLDNKFYAIGNERIHLSPADELGRLSTFLDIPMHDSMLRSTLNNLPWLGNSFYGPIETFDPSLRSTKRWLDKLRPSEAKLLESCFRDMIKEYGVRDFRLSDPAQLDIATILEFLAFEMGGDNSLLKLLETH